MSRKVIATRKVTPEFYHWVKSIKAHQPNITSAGLAKMTGSKVTSSTIRFILQTSGYQNYLRELSVAYNLKHLRQANRELTQKEYNVSFELALATHRLRVLMATSVILSVLFAIALWLLWTT
jgi:hypothetical protein